MFQEHCATLIIKKAVLIAGVFASVISAASAQNGIPHQIAAIPGRAVRIGIYSDIRPDCTSGPLPAIKLTIPPAHGTVTVKRGTLKATNLKQCLGIEVPVFVAFYQSLPDFRGADQFDLEISLSGGRKSLQHFAVDVTANASGQSGI